MRARARALPSALLRARSLPASALTHVLEDEAVPGAVHRLQAKDFVFLRLVLAMRVPAAAAVLFCRCRCTFLPGAMCSCGGSRGRSG